MGITNEQPPKTTSPWFTGAKIGLLLTVLIMLGLYIWVLFDYSGECSKGYLSSQSYDCNFFQFAIESIFEPSQLFLWTIAFIVCGIPLTFAGAIIGYFIGRKKSSQNK